MPRYCGALFGAFATLPFTITLPQGALAACASPEPARLELRMYKYNGAIAGDALSRFSSLHGIIREKLRLIKDDTIAEGIDVKYLEKLTVKPMIFDKMEPPPDDAGLAATWELQRRHLLLMYGDIQPEGNGSYQALSTLYLGGLGPQPIGKFVKADMPITPDGSKNARDTHSMVTLVALALDAMQRRCDPAVVRHLLGKADYNALDLERRGQLVGDLQKLHEFIKDHIRHLMN